MRLVRVYRTRGITSEAALEKARELLKVTGTCMVTQYYFSTPEGYLLVKLEGLSGEGLPGTLVSEQMGFAVLVRRLTPLSELKAKRTRLVYRRASRYKGKVRTLAYASALVALD